MNILNKFHTLAQEVGLDVETLWNEFVEFIRGKQSPNPADAGATTSADSAQGSTDPNDANTLEQESTSTLPETPGAADAGSNSDPNPADAQTGGKPDAESISTALAAGLKKARASNQN